MISGNVGIWGMDIDINDSNSIMAAAAGLSRLKYCWVESKTRRVMIQFFWCFLQEKEKTRVFAKDSQTEARCEERGKIGAKVNKTTNL
jgi:hypothetical protein